jgi:hypothetical protein
MLNALAANVIIIWIILEAGKEQTFLNVIAIASNVIIIWIILDSEKSKNLQFLDVNALAVNVIIIWIILDREGTNVFGCNCTCCKRYYNLDYCRQGRNKRFWM